MSAAAPGGPRHDSTLTKEGRSSIDNGIWLCQTCATLIDRDPKKFTVEVLQDWKKEAETRAEKLIGRVDVEDLDYVTEPTPPPVPLNQTSLGRYIRSSKRLAYFDETIAKNARQKLRDYESDGGPFLEMAAYFGITTVADLDRALEQHGETALKLATGARFKDTVPMRSCTLIFLFDTLACQLPTLGEHVAYYHSLKRTVAGLGFARSIREMYEQITAYGW